MRRTTKTTRAKIEARNRRHDSASGNQMTGLGLFPSSSSSSSSSSNLSPLALPFTVERSNPSKPNFDFNFNFQSSTTAQGLLSDSVRTATVPSTYSTFPNPNPSFTTSNTHNLSVIGPNPRVVDASCSTQSAYMWSSMNSSVKSGLENVNPPAGYLFGSNPNKQPHKLSFGNDVSNRDASMMPLDFNLFGSSKVSYSQSLSGSKYTSSPATCHGLVSNGSTSHYPFETRSIFYDSSSDQLSPSMSTKSLDISNTSLFNKSNNVLVSHNPLKEKESYDKISTEDVNPGEDSPCWKGTSTHFSSSHNPLKEKGSLHAFRQLKKQLEKYSDEEVLLHMDQSLHGTVENAVTSESLDVNTVVRALHNLSELLLRLYTKDECGLKEQDHKALDHVIANLSVCRSGKLHQVDPAMKCPSPMHVTSNVPREERNNDQFGKNIEEIQTAYVRDEGVPKDFNMVQKIKRVLDENLECNEDLPSDPLLYKNLWLEAEAELCVSSYKTRLHRAKREMSKSKALDLSEVAADIKKISSSNYPPTAGRKTHAPNLSTPIVEDIDDVMARYSILKRREGSNPVSMAEKEPADVKASGIKLQSSGVAEEPYLKHLLDTEVHSHGNQKMQDSVATEDVDDAVMARLNILKSREGGAERSMMQNQFGSSTFGWEYVLEG